MATDKGVRSIEVNVSNMTTANFTIQSIELGANASWIKGEEPVQGGTLMEYQSARWGVMTNDYNSVASGSVVLTGYGDPVKISFTNDEHGNSSCDATATPTVNPIVHEVSTGEQNHSQYNVTIESAD